MFTFFGHAEFAVAQAATAGSSGSVASSGPTNSKDSSTAGTKSLVNTKAAADELTYVANAESCTPKALHLGTDHGPKAATSSWINSQRVSECYSRVR